MGQAKIKRLKQRAENQAMMAVPLPTVNDDNGPIRLSKLTLDQLQEPLFIERYREFYVGLSDPAAQRETCIHESAHYLGFKLTGAKNITYEKPELSYDKEQKDYVGHAGRVYCAISTADIPEGMPLGEWMMRVVTALAAGIIAAQVLCGATIGSDKGDIVEFNNFCDVMEFEKLYPDDNRKSYWAVAQQNARDVMADPRNQAATLQAADEMHPNIFGLFKADQTTAPSVVEPAATT
jgi:hypothetical protein